MGAALRPESRLQRKGKGLPQEKISEGISWCLESEMVGGISGESPSVNFRKSARAGFEDGSHQWGSHASDGGEFMQGF
jgi:hypothetical protein